MDTAKLRMLMRVLEAGSYAGAAEDSGYSVSGISRLMAALEKETGVRLLFREHEGVSPTAECRALLGDMRELLHAEDILLQNASQIAGVQKGTIAVGIAYSHLYGRLAQAAEAFRLEHPGIRFRFIHGYSSDLLEKMEAHELDLCLISRREGDHDWLELGEEELVVWVPSGHPLAGRRSMPLEQVEKEPYIDIYPGRDTDNARMFRSCHIHPHSVTSVEDSYAAYCMVEAGMGITVNHRSVCRSWQGQVACISLDPPRFVPVGMAAPGQQKTPAARAFLSYLRQSRFMLCS